MTLSEHPWMEHDVTKARAQLPDIPYWRANGWNPCDGPYPEPDFTRDPKPESPAETTARPSAASRKSNVGG